MYLEGYHRPDYLDPDDAVYDAIQDIFSNGRTSRLYRSLVRDQQIAAVAEGFSGFPGDKYPGLFAFAAVPNQGHTPQEMRTAIHKEIEKLKTTDVTDEELAMFKTRARADLLRGLGDNQGLAEQLAIYQLRYGDWRELFNQLQKIDAVTKADVRRVANKIFVDNNRTYAMIEFEAPKRAPAGPGRCTMSRSCVASLFCSRCLALLHRLSRLRSSHRPPVVPPDARTVHQAEPWTKIPIPPLAPFIRTAQADRAEEWAGDPARGRP